MGRVAEFLSWALNTNTDKQPPEVKGDPGGLATFTAEHFSPPGIDSQPVKGDFFATHDGPGTGDEIVSGYHDPKPTNRKAEDGEIRTYARDGEGVVVCEVWCKKSGEICITSIKAGSTINLNGFIIDQDGNTSTPGTMTSDGEITTNANVAGSVSLSTHEHNTAMGPTTPPTPNT